jgi:long-chain acyl-CoA synthetase
MGKKITYAELEILVNRFANALIGLGVQRGDKVALLMPNIPQMVIAYYGIWRMGAIPVPNNPLYTDKELEHQFNDSGATALITLDLLADRMLKLRPKTGIRQAISAHINEYLPFPIKQLFPFLKKEMHAKFVAASDFYEFSDLMKRASSAFNGPPPAMDDIAIIPYTGGTTGLSKGAVLTHANTSYITQILDRWLVGMEEGVESELAIFPFFHMAGFTAVMNFCIYKGWTDILIPRPEPEAVRDATLKYKPSVFLAVPTIYTGVLNLPDFKNADLTFIKGFFSGAAPLPLETIRDLQKAANSTIVEGYGMTESTTLISVTPWGGKLKPGSVGVPLPGTDVRIVDLEDMNKELPTGEAGEIAVKGPQMLQSYYNMPEESAEAIRDGWFYTGDIGKFDEEGYLYIVDRKKDMIIAGGYNIYPRDIEEVLYEHPKILEACAVGVPHEYRGETVKAFIVPNEGETLNSEELDAFCRERLAAYKVPKIYEFVDDLPKSNIGKILRRELRDMEIAKAADKGKE